MIAIYLARSLGIDALGVPADIQPYPNSGFDTTWREWGARVKTLLQVHLRGAKTQLVRGRGKCSASPRSMGIDEHEEHTCSVETTFARDCAAAQGRLLKPQPHLDGLQQLLAERED